jgi:cobalt-zinc-cadmium efflux system membrane fusion protein
VRSTILFLLVVGAVAGCQKAKPSDEPASAQIHGDTVAFPSNGPQVAAIATETAAPTQPGQVRLTGRLVWDEDATVRVFSVMEGRVTRIAAPVGERVEKDAPLALIASPDFGQVQADAAKSALDLKLAEQTLNRLKELAANGAAAEKDLHAAEIDFARAQGEAQRTARRLELYGGKVQAADHEFALRSPLAGSSSTAARCRPPITSSRCAARSRAWWSRRTSTPGRACGRIR